MITFEQFRATLAILGAVATGVFAEVVFDGTATVIAAGASFVVLMLMGGRIVDHIELNLGDRGHRLFKDWAATQRRNAEADRWGNANDLADLSELTAQWLEGAILYHPGVHGGPDPETESLTDVLAAANRASYLTWGSQPGESWEHDGRQHHQQANVQGCVSWERLESLLTAASAAGLLVTWHAPPRRWHFATRPMHPACVHGHTRGISRAHLADLVFPGVGDGLAYVLDAPQVCASDPVPGRPERLVAALAAFASTGI